MSSFVLRLDHRFRGTRGYPQLALMKNLTQIPRFLIPDSRVKVGGIWAQEGDEENQGQGALVGFVLADDMGASPLRRSSCILLS